MDKRQKVRAKYFEPHPEVKRPPRVLFLLRIQLSPSLEKSHFIVRLDKEEIPYHKELEDLDQMKKERQRAREMGDTQIAVHTSL